jgi:hypothetical protein
VDRCKEARDIGGGVDEETKISGREMVDAGAGTVEFMERPRVQNPRHDIADHLPVRTLEKVGRPRGNSEELSGCPADKYLKFVDVVLRERSLLDLCNELGTP